MKLSETSKFKPRDVETYDFVKWSSNNLSKEPKVKFKETVQKVKLKVDNVPMRILIEGGDFKNLSP